MFRSIYSAVALAFCLSAALSAAQPAAAQTASFTSAPLAVVDTVRTGIKGDVKVLVAGVGLEGRSAAAAIRSRLHGGDHITLVLGPEALGNLTGLSDTDVFKRARRMPVDRIVVVRVYSQGEGRPKAVVAPVYDRKGDVVATISFDENAAQGVAAPGAPAPPPLSTKPPLAKPETDGLSKTSSPNPPNTNAASPKKRGAASSTTSSRNRYSVIILDPIDSDVDENTRTAIAGRMAADLVSVAAFDVITAADLRAMMSLESSRQLAGCDDDSCLSDIADALGADLVISWDISPLGRTKIVTTRLFDATTSKNMGRGQTTSTQDELLPQRASEALSQMLDDFFASFLSRSEQALEKYAAEQVDVDDVPGALSIFKKRTYFKGQDRAEIDAGEFYRTIGKNEVADELEAAASTSALFLYAGLGAIAVGTVVFSVGIVALTFPPLGIPLLIVSLPFLVGGFATFFIAALLQRQPDPLANEKRLANEHNRRLRRKLGLRDAGPKPTSSLDLPLRRLLSTTQFAVNVE